MEIIFAAAVSVITLVVAGIGAHMWLLFFDELRARRRRKRTGSDT